MWLYLRKWNCFHLWSRTKMVWQRRLSKIEQNEEKVIDTSFDMKEKKRQYRFRNKEAIKEKVREYRLKNKEAIKEKNRQYRMANKERIMEKKSLYRMKNSDTIREKGRQYHLENRNVIQEKVRQYYMDHKDSLQEKKRQYKHQNKEIIKEKERQYRITNKETIQERKRLYYLQNQDVLRQRYMKATNRFYLHKCSPTKRTAWKKPEQVRAFFESLHEQLHITSPNDWYRVSVIQISKLGGRGLIKRFGNLFQALRSVYPQYDWDETKFSLRGKKSAQRWLRVRISHLLPEETEILEDFLHPSLLWDETLNLKMELDIWVPKFNLALEYQGEQHYYDLHEAYGPNGTVAMYTERDLKKKKLCEKNGITLVTIPYWWDGNEDSLASTLHMSCPELFLKTDSPPIPTEPPNIIKSIEKGNPKIISFLMHGREWHEEYYDPTDWYISEKLDGIRAFWDGSMLYSKQGKILPIPSEFAKMLPRGIPLDGELWSGYDSFSQLLSIIKSSHKLLESGQDSEAFLLWEKNIKFCVFDAPMHSGYYQERHSFAGNSIRNISGVCVVPIERCLGLDHLQRTLNDIRERKGEGIILYNPQSPYISGRTNAVLKVK
eukprot:TRINITY_DN4111_c0_g2_i1.p1 TRINITY_DN4111_c0_g2~~TRINITY_DN4111_c0_g2_i1.p1  ORF type:complete len:658 (-),score=111.69 TRINITY_DN4111_c0_g2_i1:406-2217(-)